MAFVVLAVALALGVTFGVALAGMFTLARAARGAASMPVLVAGIRTRGSGGRTLILRSGARPGGLRVLVLCTGPLGVLGLVARALLLIRLVAAAQLLVVLHVRRNGAAAGGTLQIHVGAGAGRALYADALRGGELAE